MLASSVLTRTVVAVPLCAVRRRVRIADVAQAWKPALDLVWAYLRQHPDLRRGGHNCFLYHHPDRRDAPMDVDFGVQIVRPLVAPAEGEIVAAETPAGEVATAKHVGPYDRIKKAHDAIHAWKKETGRDFAGVSWEVYGDPADDPTKNETEVFYLLR